MNHSLSVPFIFVFEYPLLLLSKALSAALQSLKNGNFSVLKVQSKVGDVCWAPGSEQVWEGDPSATGCGERKMQTASEGCQGVAHLFHWHLEGSDPTMPAAPRSPRKLSDLSRRLQCCLDRQSDILPTTARWDYEKALDIPQLPSAQFIQHHPKYSCVCVLPIL